MIKITNIETGLSVIFKGSISRIPTKRNYNKITTIRGQELVEQVRGVINISLQIEEMNESEYFKLEKLFLFENNSLEITDIGKGNSYVNYFIDSETLNLERKEDYSKKEYYYTGNLNINKI